MLEKKKDYILRARDFHSKEKKLKQLREKAAFRNPDEFYFKMENTITRNGVHSENRNEKWDSSTLKLLKTQDQNYVNYMRSVNLKKMDKLKESLHIIDDVNEQEQNSDEECKASKHVIFVDTEKDAKKFNAAQHFNTLPEFVGRKFNRPTLDILKNSKVLNAVQKHGIPKQAKKEKAALVRELASRVNREEKLLATKMEMDTQKNLMVLVSIRYFLIFRGKDQEKRSR